jgi:hypothetical protein
MPVKASLDHRCPARRDGSTRRAPIVIFQLRRESAEANALRNCRGPPASTPEHPGNCTEMRGGSVRALHRPLVPSERAASAALILTSSACLRTSTSGRRSGDRTNTTAYLLVGRHCIASPARSLPQRVKFQQCRPRKLTAETFSSNTRAEIPNKKSFLSAA